MENKVSGECESYREGEEDKHIKEPFTASFSWWTSFDLQMLQQTIGLIPEISSGHLFQST